MKLFLVNTMKNKKSRKIGLIFLGFFYNFLEYIWLWKKNKKEKLVTVLGRFWPRSAQQRVKARLRPRAHWLLCRKALNLLDNWKRGHGTIWLSRWPLQKDPCSSNSLHLEALDGGRRCAGLRRAREPAISLSDRCPTLAKAKFKF
jgi:hypothetical protein